MTLQIRRFPFRNATLTRREHRKKGDECSLMNVFLNGSHKEERDGPSAGRDGRHPPLVTSSGGRARRCWCGRAAARSKVLFTVLKTDQSCNIERKGENVWRHMTTTTTSSCESQTRGWCWFDKIWPGLDWRNLIPFFFFCESICSDWSESTTRLTQAVILN